jgi:flotillin
LLLLYLLFCNLPNADFPLQRCPSDKILVIYGRTGGTSAKCVHGGGAFIWPVIQDYQYLDLKPLSIEANLTNAYHVKTFVWMFLVVLQLLFRPKQKV